MNIFQFFKLTHKFYGPDTGGGGGETEEQKKAREEKEKKDAAAKAKSQQDAAKSEIEKQLAQKEAELKAIKDKAEKEKREKEEADLKAKGDFEGLKKKLDDDRKAMEEQRRKEQIQNALLRAGLKSGIKKEEYLRLIDTSKLEVKDGVVVGVDEAVDSFKKDNADLFGDSSPGSGGAHGTPKGVPDTDYAKKMAEDRDKKRPPQKLF